jgi:hypothetical protein
MTVSLGNAHSSEPPPADRKQRRSFFGKIFRGTGWLAAGPVDWAGTRRIRRGWSFIGDLVHILRLGPSPDNRFKTEDRGVFDMRATAFSYGMSVPELKARLRSRRLQTARIAYAASALAWLFMCGWIWHALASPLTAMRVTSALYFLPFCALFFLIAFHNALLNFQIRTGRLANWREYLATTEKFWPC